MITLARDARRGLETTVKTARKIAEAGARKIIDERLRVGDPKAPGGLSTDEQRLRVRLRAHGRQLGDQCDPKGVQTTRRLVAECAYEHWHRMLFARFLAETENLIEPESELPISMSDCQDLARERGEDWLALASAFAVRMLPQIFRPDDPVLEVGLPPETRSALEDQLKSLARDVFLADDSLGWVYQFWQTDEKERVNKSEVKIGADELPAVTQLFTEDYMVLFLLHNTLGAWWAAKVLAARPELATATNREDELRAACAVGEIEWTYLRFVREEGGPWRPAAGTFDGWPKVAREITALDPCMGSGHFLVFALPVLVAMRMEEEGLSRRGAVDAVLRDNLHGLEIDPRCTQIAAFNLALAAWKLTGFHALPELQLACSGLTPAASEEEWLKLAQQHGMDRRTKVLGGEFILDSLRHLHKAFSQAPTLGSLIDPTQQGEGMFAVDFETLKPYLQAALKAEQADDELHERAVAAAGMVKAADLLSRTYTLVVTNVPYLGSRKQSPVLTEFGAKNCPSAKSDLGVIFMDRCQAFPGVGGTVALVMSQYWLFKSSYEEYRRDKLKCTTWDIVARLGPRAFETISGEVVNVCAGSWTNSMPSMSHQISGIDAVSRPTPNSKSEALRNSQVVQLSQADQRGNPGSRLILGDIDDASLLQQQVLVPQGVKTGDDERWRHRFWELPEIADGWVRYQSTVPEHTVYGGRSLILDWRTNGEGMVRPRVANVAVEQLGVAVSQSGSLPATLYTGERFDSNVAPIVPNDPCLVPALWAYCTSPDYLRAVRAIDQSLKVTNVPLVQVPFDEELWRDRASENGDLPEPESDDPSQWLFHGRPEHSTAPLQIAVARLLGYRWPAELDPEMRLSQRARNLLRGCEELLPHADIDGIVCLTPIKGEASAADRLVKLLAAAYGTDWSAGKLDVLLRDMGYGGKSLDFWLRDGFFENHCSVFHNRPFIWHICDGRQDGFHSLVNYHRLAASDGEGRRTLEKLIYTYLGDWVDAQRRQQQNAVDGAEARLAAAVHLKSELEKILHGEPPFDLFVRWKPLHEQPIGWEPDINDGVRINIRPFMTARPLGARAKNACILRVTPKGIKWDADRGKEPRREKADFPWFWSWDGEAQDFAGGATFDGKRWNGLHYTTAFKQAARRRQKGTA